MVTATASDGIGDNSVCTFTVTVADNEAPVISNISVNPENLGAPNHKMRDVTVSYETKNNCPRIVTTSLAVSSNEAENGSGDGDTAPDWGGTHALKLRADRSGSVVVAYIQMQPVTPVPHQ